MADSFINLQPPLAGLNLDTSPSQIEDNESPELYNFLLHEPGQMRRRYGIRRGRPMASTITSGSYPFNIMAWKNKVLVGYMADPTNVFYATYYAPSPTEPLPGSSDRTGGTVRMFRVDVSTPATTPWPVSEIVQDGILVHTAMMPWGATIQYDQAAYGCSSKPIFRRDKTGNGRTATRLVKWAGSTIAAGGDFATISNGSISGTFTGTPPTVSIADAFIRFNADVSPYHYSYQVKTHTANSANFTLYKPYGLGENTTNVPNKVASAVDWVPIDYVENSPIWCQCVAVHYERLFVGRPVYVTPVGGILPGEYPNGVAYSDATQPEKWNDTSLIIVDDRPDDAIMAFGHIGSYLAIFKSDRVYILTGYSPETFTVKLLTAEIGCIDSRSVVQIDDGVAFMSKKGYYYLDSTGIPIKLSQQAPGHGIQKRLLPEIAGNLGGKQFVSSCAALTQDHLVLSNQENRDKPSVPYHDPWMMYTKTRAWANWGNRDASIQPICFSPANQLVNGLVIAAYPLFMASIDSIFDAEPASDTMSIYPTVVQFKDDYYDASSNAQSAYIPAVCRTKDFRLWEGDTGRLRAMYVEHCVQYIGSSDPTQNGITITVDTDRDISVSAGTVGVVEPQYETGLSVPDYEKYYVREFRSGYFQREGAIFRFRLAHQNISSGTTPHVLKWYNLRLLVEQTRSGRVQDTVPS